MLVNNYALFIQATMVTIQSGLNIIFWAAFIMSNCKVYFTKGFING